MFYYTITLSYNDTSETDDFKLDKDELTRFIDFITNRITNLQSFYIWKITYASNELKDTI